MEGELREEDTVLIKLDRLKLLSGEVEEQATQLTPLVARQQQCKENHIQRQNVARLRRDIHRHKLESLGSLKNASPSPSKRRTSPVKQTTTTPSKQPPTIRVQVVFEVILSNEHKEKIKLRQGDDVAAVVGEVQRRHGLDDVRANKLKLALEEAVKTTTCAADRDKTEPAAEWEKHWDNRRQRWYAHCRATGKSKWLD